MYDEFEVFTAYGAKSRPEVTLRTSGHLFLPIAVQERAKARRATHFQALWDSEFLRLGINLQEGSGSHEPESWRELITEKSGIALNISALLRYYGLKPPKKKEVFPITVTENNLIVVNLFEFVLKQRGHKSPVTTEAEIDKLPF